MTSSPLDNLARIGQLKTEPPAQAEFDSLVWVRKSEHREASPDA